MFNPGRHHPEVSATVNPRDTLQTKGLQLTGSCNSLPVILPLNQPSGSWPGDTVHVPTETAQNSWEASMHMGNSVRPL